MKTRRFAIVVIVINLMATGSLAYADSVTQPIGIGLGLECQLCKLPPSAPEVQKSEPVYAKPKLEKWYFVSYGPDVRVHGPFSSRKSCEEIRQTMDDTDRCFLDSKHKFIE